MWCEVTYSYDLRSPLAQKLLTSYDELTHTFIFEYALQDLAPLDDDFKLESKDYDLRITALSGKSVNIIATAIIKLRVKNPCFDEIKKPFFCPVEVADFYMPGMPSWQNEL